LSDRSVDLVYLDPPFASGRDYRTVDRSSGKQTDGGFGDRWQWDEHCDADFQALCSHEFNGRFWVGMELVLRRAAMLAYLVYLAPRLSEMRRVLKDTGSLYLHCDQKASAHLKLLLDELFGMDCYLNTIVWCYGLGGSSPRRWPRKHDDILWYGKTNGKHFFAPVMEAASSERMKGMLKKTPDYWNIPSLNNMAHERTGYPTQKPLELLERIIASSCPPDSIVLDPFCGSGTTLVAAEKLGRGWIGIDSNPEAIATAEKRLSQLKQSTLTI